LAEEEGCAVEQWSAEERAQRATLAKGAQPTELTAASEAAEAEVEVARTVKSQEKTESPLATPLLPPSRRP